MNRTGLLVVPGIIIGAVVTPFAVYEMTKGLNPVVGTIIAVFALVIAGVLGVVGLGISSTGLGVDELSEKDRESLRVLRASNRAMIEDMDEIVSLLSEIRDYLTKVSQN